MELKKDLTLITIRPENTLIIKNGIIQKIFPDNILINLPDGQILDINQILKKLGY